MSPPAVMDQADENQRKKRLQKALYEYRTTTSPFKATAEKYEVPKKALQRAYNRWRKSNPNATPSNPNDVRLTKPSVGPLPTLTENEEKVMVGVALHSADNSIPLTKTDSLSLAKKKWLKCFGVLMINKIIYQLDLNRVVAQRFLMQKRRTYREASPYKKRSE